MKKRILSILLATLTLLTWLPFQKPADAASLRCMLRGDADGDGEITATDARLILRCSVGLESPGPKQRPFFTYENIDRVTAMDARYVLRLSVGLEDRPLHYPGNGRSVSAATCTEPEQIETTCRCCGAVYLTEGEAAKGHTPGNWEITEKATCIEEGRRERRCTVCEEVLAAEALPLTDHVYGDMQCDQGLNCEKAQNVYYICKVCGARKNEVKYASSHNFKWVTTIAPTCTTSGLREEICTVCGYKTGEAQSLPGGNGYILSAWEIVIAPTATNDGKRVRRCLRCEQIIEEEILPKLG